MSRRLLNFLLAFVCVFAGLALAHGLGPSYSKAHAALGNFIVGAEQLQSGVRLHFDANDNDLSTHPWRMTLHVAQPSATREITVPIDLRSLLFLPTAAFIALAIAVPLHSLRAHLQLLGFGLLILEPFLLLLVALPLLSFLGGTGPIRAFVLGRPAHVVLQILYRALVAPPGMAYALPLLWWWVLVARLSPARAVQSLTLQGESS